MKAILFDPCATTDEDRIREVEWTGRFAGAGGAYELMSSRAKRVDTIDVKALGKGLLLLIDDEGGLVDGNPVMDFAGFGIIAGRVLLVGDAHALAPAYAKANHVAADADFCDVRLVNKIPAPVLHQVVAFPPKVTTGEFEPGRDMTPDEAREASGGLCDFGFMATGPIILRDPDASHPQGAGQ